MPNDTSEDLPPQPFAEFVAKKDGTLSVREVLNFLDLISRDQPTILDNPLSYIFDGEYQSGFEKILFEDGEIRLVDNG